MCLWQCEGVPPLVIERWVTPHLEIIVRDWPPCFFDSPGKLIFRSFFILRHRSLHKVCSCLKKSLLFPNHAHPQYIRYIQCGVFLPQPTLDSCGRHNWTQGNQSFEEYSILYACLQLWDTCGSSLDGKQWVALKIRHIKIHVLQSFVM